MSEATVIEHIQELVANGYSPDTNIVGYPLKCGSSRRQKLLSGLRQKTWLVMAALYNYEDAVKMIAKHGGDLNRQDFGGRTPVNLVAASRHRDGLRYMLTPSACFVRAATISVASKGLRSPAQEAAQMVRVLARLGANLNIADEGNRSPAWMAAHDDAVEVLKVLAVYGADLTLCDVDEFSPLDTAADLLNHNSVAFLCWTQNWSPLRIGLACDMIKDVRWGLRHGVLDPDSQGINEMMTIRHGATCMKCKLNISLCNPKAYALGMAATSGWSWKTHWLHHAGVRQSIYVTLLVAQRLAWKCAAKRETITLLTAVSAAKVNAEVNMQSARALPHLPVELWHIIMGFYLRGSWNVLVDPRSRP